MPAQGKRSSDVSYGKFLLLCKREEHNTLVVGKGGGERASRALKLYGHDHPVVEDPALGAAVFIWHRWEDLAALGEAVTEEKAEKAFEESTEN